MKQNRISRILFLFLIFGVGFIAALYFAHFISIPFSNPWNITGPLTIIQYNPLNNIARFLFLVLLPSIFLILISFYRKMSCILFTGTTYLSPTFFDEVEGTPSQRSRKYLLVIAILFCILMAMNVPTPFSNGAFDSFHEGESLGTSVSLANGKVPYKDIIFAHGLFQDPLRAAVAFKLFGRSIGSVRTLESILKILCFVLLFFFIFILFEGNYFYIYLVLLSLLPILLFGHIIILPRDITTFSFLAVAASFVSNFTPKVTTSKINTFTKLFVFSFLPITSFCYSVDRGFYLLATYCILFPVIIYCCYEKGIYLYSFLFSLLGLISGIGFLGFLLHWEYGAFFDFVFVTMPRYKELMDGKVYPFNLIEYILPILLISSSCYFMVYIFIRALQTKGKATWPFYIKAHFMELCLLIVSIFYFRNALGRSDSDHVRYSFVFIFILVAYILIKHFLHRQIVRYKEGLRFKIYASTFLISMLGCVFIFEIQNKGLLIDNFPLKRSDSTFIYPHYKRTISFLKNNLSDKEGFFTMTSEGSWYYFIDKPCPTRFPVVWFAMPPFYQSEIVSDLKKKEVKFILYANYHWANRIDGFSSPKRLPIVDEYIKSDYRYFATIDGNHLWIKKRGN